MSQLDLIFWKWHFRELATKSQKHVLVKISSAKISYNIYNTVKPLNCIHLRVLKSLSVNERCVLLKGNLKKAVTFGTDCFVCSSRHVCYWEVSLVYIIHT